MGYRESHLPAGIAVIIEAVARLSMPLAILPFLLLTATEFLLVFSLAVSILPCQLILGPRIALFVAICPAAVWNLSLCFTAQELVAVGTHIAPSCHLARGERDLSVVALTIAENTVTSPSTAACLVSDCNRTLKLGVN
jgi:riboflavin transporter FmnP